MRNMRLPSLDSPQVAKVAKPLYITSVALLIVSLIGFFATRPLPDEVEQETDILSYEHAGSFDYLIHLKPSYLFGPPPQETPANPEYPAQIVDTIAFTFSYSPTEPATEVVSIDAVLENPGVWQKKIKLVPYTSREGDFSLRFILYIDQIDELFDAIEEEINIRSSPRRLTIQASVTAPKESFIHTLPIELGRTLIKVDADLRHTQACGVGQFDYAVNLKENSIFDTRTLRPPSVVAMSSSTTLKPGQVVFSRLIDSMDVTFYYQFKSSRPATKITSDVEITALVEATDLWSKKFPLLYQKESGDFKLSFPLDLVGYMELFQTIREETGASGESSTVTITADVHTVAETPFGVIDETFSHPMKLTLAGSIVEWDEELEKSQPGSIKKMTVVPNPNKYLGLSVNGVQGLSTALVGIFLLLCVLSVGVAVMFKPVEPPRIQKETLRLGKKYGERMVEATSQMPVADGQTISLGSMEDLIKIADELGKPIIHQPPGTSERGHAYYVFDGVARYQYVLTADRKEQTSDRATAE